MAENNNNFVDLTGVIGDRMQDYRFQVNLLRNTGIPEDTDVLSARLEAISTAQGNLLRVLHNQIDAMDNNSTNNDNTRAPNVPDRVQTRSITASQALQARQPTTAAADEAPTRRIVILPTRKRIIEESPHPNAKYRKTEIIDLSEPKSYSRKTETIDLTEDDEEVQEVPTSECPICLERRPQSQLFKLRCKHTYCGVCLQKIFKQSLKNISKFPPTCCRTEIVISNLSEAIGSRLSTKYSLRYEELSTPDRTYCANLKCSKFIPNKYIKDGVAECQSCSSGTCVLCREPAHPDQKCPKDAFTALSQKEGWQRCTRCKRMVILEHGCNHITCVCGYHFCYECGGPWRTCQCNVWDEANIIYGRQRGRRHGAALAADARLVQIQAQRAQLQARLTRGEHHLAALVEEVRFDEQRLTRLNALDKPDFPHHRVALTAHLEDRRAEIERDREVLNAHYVRLEDLNHQANDIREAIDNRQANVNRVQEEGANAPQAAAPARAAAPVNEQRELAGVDAHEHFVDPQQNFVYPWAPGLPVIAVRAEHAQAQLEDLRAAAGNAREALREEDPLFVRNSARQRRERLRQEFRAFQDRERRQQEIMALEDGLRRGREAKAGQNREHREQETNAQQVPANTPPAAMLLDEQTVAARADAKQGLAGAIPGRRPRHRGLETETQRLSRERVERQLDFPANVATPPPTKPNNNPRAGPAVGREVAAKPVANAEPRLLHQIRQILGPSMVRQLCAPRIGPAQDAFLVLLLRRLIRDKLGKEVAGRVTPEAFADVTGSLRRLLLPPGEQPPVDPTANNEFPIEAIAHLFDVPMEKPAAMNSGQGFFNGKK